MKVIGIDPGLSNTGWAIVSRSQQGAFRLVDCGCIATDKKDADAKRILVIYRHIRKRLRKHAPDLLAVERVFFNHNPSSCLSTAGVSYICQLAAEQVGIESLTFTPQQVKAAVGCGGRANKTAVKRFVSKLTNTTLNNSHTADAVATAICGLLKMRTHKKRAR